MFKNIGMGLLVLVGIIVAIAVVSTLIVSLPAIALIGFILIKGLAIVSIVVGIIWALGLGVNKLVSINKNKKAS